MIIDQLRLVGSTQTNVVMAAELSRIAKRVTGKRPPEPRKEGLGQLIYPFDKDLAFVAVTYLRTPTRVVWDVYRTPATRLEPMYDELLDDITADPRKLFRDGDGISVDARHVADFAAGERQVVGTVKNALIEGALRRRVRLHVEPDHPATRWIARLDDHGEIVVSIDLGGGSLSQRGWRREHGEAPLREHLAAVLLMLCRFDPRVDVLVDPMCGSGTIPIEAIHAARATPRATPMLAALGIRDPREPNTTSALFPDAAPVVIGCDLDLEVLAAARDNARSADVSDAITWQRADVTRLQPQTILDICAERNQPNMTGRTGLILTNPPYGERLDDPDLSALYDAIAHTCRAFRGWRAGFLVGTPLFEDRLTRVLGRPRIKKPLANANLRAYFLLWDL